MKNIYEETINIILKQLDKGELPWTQPWNSLPIFPINYFTSRPYHGFNMIWLFYASRFKNYSCPFWGGFKQISNAGGHIKKGEKATRIYRVTYKNATDDNATSTNINEYGEKQLPVVKKYPILLCLNVFNLEQVEGIDYLPALNKAIDERKFSVPNEMFQKYISLHNIGFRNNDYSAYYDDILDIIHVPNISQFPDPNEYWQTAFHEAAHSTGHSKRLNRKSLVNYKEDHQQNEEELIAEIASSFLMAECGMQFDVKNTTSYIAGWSSYLKDQRKSLIIKASNMADSAVRLILGKTEEYSNDIEESKDNAA